jgi:hypothetical protein
MGSVEGLQGRWSSGEPFKTDGDLPSPTQFHTRDVGQSRVIACGQQKQILLLKMLVIATTNMFQLHLLSKHSYSLLSQS